MQRDLPAKIRHTESQHAWHHEVVHTYIRLDEALTHCDCFSVDRVASRKKTWVALHTLSDVKVASSVAVPNLCSRLPPEIAHIIVYNSTSATCWPLVEKTSLDARVFEILGRQNVTGLDESLYFGMDQ